MTKNELRCPWCAKLFSKRTKLSFMPVCTYCTEALREMRGVLRRVGADSEPMLLSARPHQIGEIGLLSLAMRAKGHYKHMPERKAQLPDTTEGECPWCKMHSTKLSASARICEYCVWAYMYDDELADVTSRTASQHLSADTIASLVAKSLASRMEHGVCGLAGKSGN